MNNNATNILFFPEKFFKNKLEEIKNTNNIISNYNTNLFSSDNFSSANFLSDNYSFIKKANHNIVNLKKYNPNKSNFNRFVFYN